MPAVDQFSGPMQGVVGNPSPGRINRANDRQSHKIDSILLPDFENPDPILVVDWFEIGIGDQIAGEKLVTLVVDLSLPLPNVDMCDPAVE